MLLTQILSCNIDARCFPLCALNLFLENITGKDNQSLKYCVDNSDYFAAQTCPDTAWVKSGSARSYILFLTIRNTRYPLQVIGIQPI
jgi:hypothetical protein